MKTLKSTLLILAALVFLSACQAPQLTPSPAGPATVPPVIEVQPVSGADLRGCTENAAPVTVSQVKGPLAVVGKATGDGTDWFKVTDPTASFGWIPMGAVTGAPSDLSKVPNVDGTCATATQQAVSQPPAALPTDTPLPTGTPLPTSTPAPAGWVFSLPPDPSSLPTKLLDSIQYVKPVDNCASANDANGTCSTVIGQSTDSDFTLQSMRGIRVTGDKTQILQNNSPLTGNFSASVKHVAWIVINKSGADLQLHMTAPDGSFRGYFVASWNDGEIANMVNLGIYQFLVANNPLPTPAVVNPTPVPNCGPTVYTPTTACHESNVNIAVWDGSNWTKISGFYNEDQVPNWSQQ